MTLTHQPDGRQQGVLILVVGPSGVGKDTLLDGAKALLASGPEVVFPAREITRPDGAGGEDHIAVSAAEFAARRAGGCYALAWEAHGLSYGVPASIREAIAAGRTVVVNVSRAVIGEARAGFARVAVIAVAARPETVRARLLARGRETAAEIDRRLARTVGEAPAADHVIDNDESPESGSRRLADLILGLGGQVWST